MAKRGVGTYDLLCVCVWRRRGIALCLLTVGNASVCVFCWVGRRIWIWQEWKLVSSNQNRFKVKLFCIKGQIDLIVCIACRFRRQICSDNFYVWIDCLACFVCSSGFDALHINCAARSNVRSGSRFSNKLDRFTLGCLSHIDVPERRFWFAMRPSVHTCLLGKSFFVSPSQSGLPAGH